MIEWVKRAIPIQIPSPKSAEQDSEEQVYETGQKPDLYGVVDPKSAEVGIAGYDHGVEEADKRNQSEEASKSCKTDSATNSF